MQKFVVSKSSKNALYRCKYNQLEVDSLLVENMHNPHNFYDTKAPLSDRVATWEMPLQPADKLVPSSVTGELQGAVEQIAAHVRENAGVRILSAVYYFKRDRNEKLQLLFATNIRTDKVEPHTLERQEVVLTLKVGSY